MTPETDTTTSVKRADKDFERHKEEVMTRLEQAREQVAYLARVLETKGISVRIRQEVDVTIAYVSLPNRTFLKKITEAQTKVFQQYGEPAFDIIPYYPEDLQRKSIERLITKAVPI